MSCCAPAARSKLSSASAKSSGAADIVTGKLRVPEAAARRLAAVGARAFNAIANAPPSINSPSVTTSISVVRERRIIDTSHWRS